MCSLAISSYPHDFVMLFNALLLDFWFTYDSVVYHILDSHALVQFINEDDKTSIVPIKRIAKKDELMYQGSCDVIWSNNKKYRGFLIFSGTF